MSQNLIDWFQVSSLSDDSSLSSISYTTEGGESVHISFPIHPWKMLGLCFDASQEEVKKAFRKGIRQPKRQSRAVVSIANHILTSAVDRYECMAGTDEFIIKKRDHFVLAAAGHTQELVSLMTRENILDDTDEHGRTLLYLACKSGFYDMSKMLLRKGASVNKTQIGGSTPLHGAVYFGHTLVVGLLLEHGAPTNVKNNFGHTAFEETADPEIETRIQAASTDRILSLAASLRKKRLVTNVKHIEYRGKVIAKELPRDPTSLDVRTRTQWNNIIRNWEPVWHGTRYKNVQSILKKGLLPSGSHGIQPSKGHFALGKEHFGIENWAAAIFVSPSILYAGHAAYAERVLSESKQWCVLIKAVCQPESYKSYDSTVLKYDPIEGEPEQPEYRVPVKSLDENVILLVESSSNVVVRSVVFVCSSFLESQEINFDEALKIFN